MTEDAKRCPKCGYLQIIEAFPVHQIRGRPQRSSWCSLCWMDHHVKQRGIPKRLERTPV